MLALAGLAFGQQSNQTTQQPPPAKQQPEAQKQAPPPQQPQQKKPSPLFGGQLGIRSARTTKESATLGFNGIDPAGKVDQKMLATPVTPADVEKAKNLGQPRPAAADVQAFAREGGLKTK